MADPYRLKRQEEFARVMRQGRTQSNTLLLLRAAPNQLATSRFGYAISKQVGSAVVRNMVRRRLREIARRMSVKPGFDLVVTARQTAATADFPALRTSLESLIRWAGLLEAPLQVDKLAASKGTK